MNKNLPVVIVLLIVISMFAWALFAPKENISKKISKKINEQKQKADLFMKGVTFSEITGGVKYWEIKSISSEINKNKDTAYLSETVGAFFKKGIPTFHIISPKILWNMKSKEIFIDSALGFSKSFKFETKKLYWSLASKKLKTDEDVIIERGDSTIYAKGFTADIALENIELAGRPRAEIKTGRKDGLLNIEADRFEIDGKNGIIKAIGLARANRGELNLNCGQLQYREKVKIITADENVKITFNDILAGSDSASYNINNDKIILSGHAAAKRGENELTGDKLIINLKDNKIGVVGRTKAVIQDEVITKEMNSK